MFEALATLAACVACGFFGWIVGAARAFEAGRGAGIEEQRRADAQFWTRFPSQARGSDDTDPDYHGPN